MRDSNTQSRRPSDYWDQQETSHITLCLIQADEPIYKHRGYHLDLVIGSVHGLMGRPNTMNIQP
jgi:hypothetical protein